MDYINVAKEFIYAERTSNWEMYLNVYRKCSICLQLQVTLITPRVSDCTCNKLTSFQKRNRVIQRICEW